MEAAERARRAAAEAQRALDVFRQQNNLDGGQPPAASASPDPHGGERGFGLLRQLFAQCPSPGKGGPCCMLAAPGAAPASSPDLGIMGRGLACTSAYFWITEDEHGRRGVHKRATVGMLKSCRTTPHINCPLRTCLGTPVKYAKSQDKAKMPLPPMQVRAGKLVPRPARALGRRCSWNTPTRPAQQPPRSCGSSSAMRPSGACSGAPKDFGPRAMHPSSGAHWLHKVITLMTQVLILLRCAAVPCCCRARPMRLVPAHGTLMWQHNAGVCSPWPCQW